MLTAAHCVDGDAKPTWISVGAKRGSGTDEGEQTRVINVVIHPEFDRGSAANDLALVEIEYPSYQTPVPIHNSPYTPGSGVVLGYGALGSIDDQPLPSDELRYALFDIIARKGKCEQLLGEPVDSSMFCAGGGEMSKDACAGDSGGPLVVESLVKSDFVALLGVISYGKGFCGVSKLPGVYSNVTKAEAFIRMYAKEAKWTSDLSEELFPGVNYGAAPGFVDPPATSPAPGGSSSPSKLPEPSSSLAPSALVIDTNSTSAANSTTTTTSKPPKTARPSAGSTYEVPVNLSPGVKDALIGFLIGDTAQVNSGRLKDVFQDGKLVFTSTQSLDGLEVVIAQHDQKPQYQRQDRFPEQERQSSQC